MTEEQDIRGQLEKLSERLKDVDNGETKKGILGRIRDFYTPHGSMSKGRVFGTAGLALLIVAGTAWMSGDSEADYRGNANGYGVVYDEGSENSLELKDGVYSFEFIDREGGTSIDWANDTEPDFSEDRLETVIVTRPGERRVFDRKDANARTLTGRKTKALFEAADKCYYLGRGVVRKQKRGEYTEGMGELLEALKGMTEAFGS